ncbi:hypothetical protein CN423_06310 [Bacillus cereus]|nr:hypothetical protein CON14_18105 [Bacillus cereus]PEQ35711.1 hypothetical protein CN466_13465 [Bacillus cereus]PEV67954.1 hypothetical protein CN423_06310 [Bacillus cereus]PEX59568.1 hypothetical protein CN463_21855 [Bacillus cereus]PFC25860.1 hypothetical protein CN264_12275 [Bacillus cereus]
MLTKRPFYKRKNKLFILFEKFILGIKKAPQRNRSRGEKGKGELPDLQQSRKTSLSILFCSSLLGIR